MFVTYFLLVHCPSMWSKSCLHQENETTWMNWLKDKMAPNFSTKKLIANMAVCKSPDPSLED